MALYQKNLVFRKIFRVIEGAKFPSFAIKLNNSVFFLSIPATLDRKLHFFPNSTAGASCRGNSFDCNSVHPRGAKMFGVCKKIAISL